MHGVKQFDRRISSEGERKKKEIREIACFRLNKTNITAYMSMFKIDTRFLYLLWHFLTFEVNSYNIFFYQGNHLFILVHTKSLD